ncbi:MAG: SLBB domain-containing protein [Sedimentisphaerales bacterium]|nr:SLBB domain-containing protein [Sedimentisphaerales bacterium]
MNFARRSTRQLCCLGGVVIAFLFLSSGCSDNVQVSTEEQLKEFLQAGPLAPQVDVDALNCARIITGEYRLVQGDLLELQIPAVLHTTSPSSKPITPGTSGPHLCRVQDDGMITLPVIGAIAAEDKTISEIEKAVTDAYYPLYLTWRPAIVTRVIEPRTFKVSITGAVEKPGLYELRHDQMTLVSVIMEAGGIVEDGAAVIRIDQAQTESPLVLPVKGLNIPFSDVVLAEGAQVEVEGLNPEVFTVVGLVNHPGAYPYPANVRYTLMQALAFAGGVNDIANPRFVRVYRCKTDGELVDATFALKGTHPAAAPNVLLKPGDVVAVEQTPRTHANLLMAEMLQLRIGATALGTYTHWEGKDFRDPD